MMKNIFLTIFCTILWSSTFGQDPLYLKNKNLPCVERTFFVYVHIAVDSVGDTNMPLQRLDSLFKAANDAFAPICISFDYCKIDTIVDYSFDDIKDEIEVGLVTSRFQKKRRINLYFTDKVLDERVNSFSVHNGITKSDECIVIVPKSGKGLMHELGHTFGLYHTFEAKFGLELVNQSNCATAGDLICDTPADPNIGPNIPCEFISNLKDPNGDFYKTEIGNYMSHHFCAHCFFSREQYELMAKNYLNSTFKMW